MKVLTKLNEKLVVSGAIQGLMGPDCMFQPELFTQHCSKFILQFETKKT